VTTLSLHSTQAHSNPNPPTYTKHGTHSVRVRVNGVGGG